MKTTNKLAILFSMILFIGFTACDKDDDDKKDEAAPPSIVGTWNLVHSKGYEKENGKIVEQWDEDIEDTNDWVIKSNGTVTFWMEGEKYIAPYKYENNKLILGDEEEGETVVFNVLKATSDELILEHKLKEGTSESYEKVTFHKVQ